VPSTYVALDLETTGLDPAEDAVTEVGMVRFDLDGRELDTFASLVNPGRPIPLFVQGLTGVSDADVAGAPTLSELAGHIRSFAGDAALVGHNVEFDLACLRARGITFPGPPLDTAAFSRLVFPGRRARSLGELAAELGIPSDEAHRALADARTAARLFVELRRLALALPQVQLAQLVRLLQLTSPEFAAVLGGVVDAPGVERPPLRPPVVLPRLEPRDPPTPVSHAALDRAFVAAGQAWPGFETRPQQREMAGLVLDALNAGGRYLVEAGTGVGKSLAYLLPAALHALRNGQRVVVSTNTIALQEQVLHKDIPALREVLVADGIITDSDDLRAVLLKGRANYLCLQRWSASLAAPAADPDFAHLAASMLLWLPETETGDRSELGLDNVGWRTWPRFSAQDTDCLTRQNQFVRDGYCFLQRARKAAESAHILVVNHALLLADAATGGSALPTFDALVIDEAHNLEDVATRQFGRSVTPRMLRDALDGLHRAAGPGQRAGGVAEVLKAASPNTRPAGESLERAVGRVSDSLPAFFGSLARMLPGQGDDDRLLLSGALRSSPDWQSVESAMGTMDALIRDVVARALEGARIVAPPGGDATDALAGEVESTARRLDELRDSMATILSGGDEGTVRWLARDRSEVELHSAPLDVGTPLREEIFDRCRVVIGTSATLATGRDARYAARRLGLDDADFRQLGSPFDYERSTLLALVQGLPEPTGARSQGELVDAIARLVRASGGRALCLFTSHSSLQVVAAALRPLLEQDGIAVLAQGVDGPPARLVGNLREQPRSVILGTASFWEGVDIRGEALSLLVIVRLPFAVPTDPIHQARGGLYDNPFAEYALPSAILRFRQGFGRLIRDHSDRGVVAILDGRVTSRSYGRDFLAALPRCTVLRGDVASAAAATREWLT